MKTRPAEALVQFFNDNNLDFHERDPGTAYQYGISHDDIHYDVITVIQEDPQALIVLCRLPIMVPQLRRTEGVRLLNRLNLGTRFGSWTLDESDGEFTLRLFQLIPGDDSPRNLIAHTIAISAVICASQAIGLMQFALGNLSAAEALQLINKEQETTDEDSGEFDFSAQPPEPAHPPARFGFN
jgi:hypothetical protein